MTRQPSCSIRCGRSRILAPSSSRRCGRPSCVQWLITGSGAYRASTRTCVTKARDELPDVAVMALLGEPPDRPVVITGAAGFIGFHVATRLLRQGHPVI